MDSFYMVHPQTILDLVSGFSSIVSRMIAKGYLHMFIHFLVGHYLYEHLVGM